MTKAENGYVYLVQPSSKILKMDQVTASHRILNTAIATCYSPHTPNELFEIPWDSKQDAKFQERFEHCVNSGHHSVLEHVTMTFAVTCTRACSHQLVRHRLTSFSQQSQRYVVMDKIPIVVPPSCTTSVERMDIFIRSANENVITYKKLLASGVPAEDARKVLPAATATNLVVSMNYRQLMHVFQERRCACAEHEIRSIFDSLHTQCESKDPKIFSHPAFGPKCHALGYCPESEDRTCGDRSLKKTFLA